MCNYQVLLNRKELIEGERVPSLQFLRQFRTGLRPHQIFPISFGTDESVVGFVGVEDVSDHEDLFLVESLIEVSVHFEVGVDVGLLRL